jgi:hypothetical protein
MSEHAAAHKKKARRGEIETRAICAFLKSLGV